MEKSESIKELAAALNKVQATIQAAKKDSVNPFFKSTYADLSSVWDACRKELVDNGLSVTQIADMDTEGRAVLETVLMHTSGEWIKGRLPLSTVKTDPQGQGSALTYARRYSLSAIVGLCTEEDDDAEGSMDRGKAKKKEEKKAPESLEIQPKPPLIDTNWLKESLEEINWADVSKWLMEHYPEAKGNTVRVLASSLTREHQEAFAVEVQARLESYRSEQQ